MKLLFNYLCRKIQYMRLLLLLVMFFITTTGFSMEDWGQTGHRVTGEIAERHLSRKVKKKIDKILNGKSLALVSTYGDDIKSDPRYRQYGPWHYVNLDPDQTTYDEDQASLEGDIVIGIRQSVEALKNKSTPPKDQEFYLKMLVHLVGDLHQPFHTGRGEDKGGNDIEVLWFNESTNIHRVWDSQMIDGFQMSYTELADNAADLSRAEVKAISKGSVLDWMYESKELSDLVYDSVELGDKLGYEYSYQWLAVVREQLQKGGIRLAALLNEILG